MWSKDHGVNNYVFWGQYDEVAIFDKDLSDDHKPTTQWPSTQQCPNDAVTEDPSGSTLCADVSLRDAVTSALGIAPSHKKSGGAFLIERSAFLFPLLTRRPFFAFFQS